METENIDNCKIMSIALISKFLGYTRAKQWGLPESSVEVSGKEKGS